mmetsp:Transcript_23531/g.51167  ORF Transcript_23531/g.51167 Transcript_23531/m.51167 type:complete len:250 (-) Transcript_23531:314-1063(-)
MMAGNHGLIGAGAGVIPLPIVTAAITDDGGRYGTARAVVLLLLLLLPWWLGGGRDSNATSSNSSSTSSSSNGRSTTRKGDVELLPNLGHVPLGCEACLPGAGGLMMGRAIAVVVVVAAAVGQGESVTARFRRPVESEGMVGMAARTATGGSGAEGRGDAALMALINTTGIVAKANRGGRRMLLLLLRLLSLLSVAPDRRSPASRGVGKAMRWRGGHHGRRAGGRRQCGRGIGRRSWCSNSISSTSSSRC